MNIESETREQTMFLFHWKNMCVFKPWLKHLVLLWNPNDNVRATDPASGLHLLVWRNCVEPLQTSRLGN